MVYASHDYGKPKNIDESLSSQREPGSAADVQTEIQIVSICKKTEVRSSSYSTSYNPLHEITSNILTGYIQDCSNNVRLGNRMHNTYQHFKHFKRKALRRLRLIPSGYFYKSNI